MDSESELLALLAQITFLGRSTDPDSVRESELASLIIQTISHVSSMDLDSLPKPESKLISLIKQIISLFHNSEPESEVVSLITQIINLANSKDSNLAPSRESELISLFSTICSIQPEPEIMSLVDQVGLLVISMNPESKLISLITRLGSLLRYMDPERESELISLVSQIIFLISSMDLDSMPKPESEVISLITQIISLFTSLLELEPESEIVSLVYQIISIVSYKDLEAESVEEAMSLINQLFSLEPEPELVSLITRTIYLCRSVKWEPEHFISLSPQVEVKLDEGGKFRVTAKVQQGRNIEGECELGNLTFYRITTGDYTAHLRCLDCNGEGQEEYEKAPIEVKHPLHPKHSLHLVLLRKNSGTRKCYCCDEDLIEIFYYCPVCDLAMNIACVNRPT